MISKRLNVGYAISKEDLFYDWIEGGWFSLQSRVPYLYRNSRRKSALLDAKRVGGKVVRVEVVLDE